MYDSGRLKRPEQSFISLIDPPGRLFEPAGRRDHPLATRPSGRPVCMAFHGRLACSAPQGTDDGHI